MVEEMKATFGIEAPIAYFVNRSSDTITKSLDTDVHMAAIKISSL